MKPSTSNSKILNLFLIQQFEKQQADLRWNQKTAIGTSFFPKNNKRVKLDNRLPSTEGTPDKWANQSINHNLKQFLLNNDIADSGNIFNDHSQFEGVPVLREEWINIPSSRQIIPNPRRKVKEVNGCRFQVIFSVCTFDKNSPILLDRDGRVLDGMQRLRTLSCHTEAFTKVYVKVLDFE